MFAMRMSSAEKGICVGLRIRMSDYLAVVKGLILFIR